MSDTRQRRLWVVRLNRRMAALGTGVFADDVMEALSSAPPVTRYHRTWHVTRPEPLAQGFVGAKLGFETAAAARTARFDPEQRDFITEQRVSEVGSFAHFVVDPETQMVVFEAVPPDIRRQSFVGALSEVLSRADRPFDVDLVPDEQSLEAFLLQVPVIRRFHARIVPPNPTYRARAQRARELIEPTQASETVVDSRVAKERKDGLVVRDTILGDIAEHVIATNGRVRMTGQGPGDRRRFYDSARQLMSGEIEITVDESSSSLFARLVDFTMEVRNRWARGAEDQ